MTEQLWKLVRREGDGNECLSKFVKMNDAGELARARRTN